ncbi:MAG: FeoA family protein [Planctomycetota bacterium]
MLRTSLNTEGREESAATAPSRRLDELSVGEAAELLEVGGERLFRRRLLELGLLPGTRVRLVRRAELGGLLELEVRGAVLSLRLSDAHAIRIEGERGR